mmetsp:Transcript_13667/g.23435  ORF Transcript_13667/g.23435 Transcript_13667/m.23435 type:complete len:329 (+) Transcript_13667:225-1211(+)
MAAVPTRQASTAHHRPVSPPARPSTVWASCRVPWVRWVHLCGCAFPAPRQRRTGAARLVECNATPRSPSLALPTAAVLRRGTAVLALGRAVRRCAMRRCLTRPSDATKGEVRQCRRRARPAELLMSPAPPPVRIATPPSRRRPRQLPVERRPVRKPPRPARRHHLGDPPCAHSQHLLFAVGVQRAVAQVAGAGKLQCRVRLAAAFPVPHSVPRPFPQHSSRSNPEPGSRPAVRRGWRSPRPARDRPRGRQGGWAVCGRVEQRRDCALAEVHARRRQDGRAGAVEGGQGCAGRAGHETLQHGVPPQARVDSPRPLRVSMHASRHQARRQ